MVSKISHRFHKHEIYQIILTRCWGICQYLVANPLVLMTFSALLGMDSTKVRTVFFWIFSHSSRTTTCKSATVLGGGFLVLITFFRTIHRCSTALRSGLCAGYLRLVRLCFVFQDVTILARWTGALSFCKIVSKGLRRLSANSGKKCFCKIWRYFLPVTLPSTVMSGTTPSQDMQPHAIIDVPPASVDCAKNTERQQFFSWLAPYEY